MSYKQTIFKRIGWLVIGLLVLLPWLTHAQVNPTVQITPNPVTQQAANGQNFNFLVQYDNSVGDNTTTGLGLRIHWNSSKVTLTGVSNTFDTNRQPYDTTFSCQDDTATNYDGDADTNCYFVMSWVDIAGSWPGVALPVTLYQANFSSSIVGAPTNINFSASSVPAGFDFSSVSAVISGGPAQATLTPDPLQFGQQLVNTTSAAMQVRLENTGSEDLIISNGGVQTTGDFTYTGGTTCANPVTAGTSCTFDVTFTPTATGTRTGTFTLTSNASNSPTSVALRGEGVDSNVVITPAPYDYGNVLPSDGQQSKIFTVSNVGGAPITLANPAVGLTGDLPPFGIGTTDCNGFTLQANSGNSCSVRITFDPGATGVTPGSYSATLNISDASGVVATANLTGRVTAPELSVTPTNLVYGDVLVGQSSTLTVTLQNTGTSTLYLTSISFTTGTHYSQSNNCGSTIGVNGTCTVNVTFMPTVAGAPLTDSLQVVWTDSNSATVGDPGVVNLTGNGVVRAIPDLTGISGFNGNFGQIEVGSSSTQSFTLSNVGNIELLGVSVGTVADPFTLSHNCDTSLGAPGNLAGVPSSCQIDVTCSPGVVGNFTDTLVITTENGTPTTVTVDLQCIGDSPAKAVPTLSAWGLILMSMLLGIFGFARSRKLH